MNRPKIFLAIFAGSNKRNTPAQPAHLRFGSKANRADLFRLIKAAKMAQKIFCLIHFGIGSCGRHNIIVAYV